MRKIVYFDENSATDYLTILNGGTLVLQRTYWSEKFQSPGCHKRCHKGRRNGRKNISAA